MGILPTGSLSSEQLAMREIQTRLDLLNNVSGREEDDRPFLVADLGVVTRQHQRWTRNLPAFKPFYAVKCNEDPRLLRHLAEAGTGFDCASIHEMQLVCSLGVDPSRIVLANPCKAASVLRTASKLGVTKMMYDNLDELDSIKSFSPDAQLFLRIHADDKDALIHFGDKFGAPVETTPVLLERAWELGLEVVGVSFHIGALVPFPKVIWPGANIMKGTGASNAQVFVDSMQRARTIFDFAASKGHPLSYLDIGGGFQDSNFEAMAARINQGVKLHMPPGVQLLAEPGRYYARNAYTLVCKVISRRRHIGEDQKMLENSASSPGMLYQNDGVFGLFMNVLVEHEVIQPVLATPTPGQTSDTITRELREHWYSIWGPTCDSTDCLNRNVRMKSEVKVGDWLVYKNMGAYSLSTKTFFNGFASDHPVIYINSENQVNVGEETKALPLVHVQEQIDQPMVV